MRKVIFTFVLLALIAPFAAAEAPPAVDEAAAEVPDADAFFAELTDVPQAESKKACPDTAPGDCTRDFDCELLYGPNPCDGGTGQWICDNPTGGSCEGTCYCC